MLTWSFVVAARPKGSFENWHIQTYLSTPATDDTYVAGAVPPSQRAKTVHRGVDEALGVLEKMKHSSQK